MPEGPGGRTVDGTMSSRVVAQSGFKTVVVGVDGRSGGRDAVALASVLLAPGGRLVLTTVVRPRGAARLGALFADAERRAAGEMLDAERQRLEVPASAVVAVGSAIPDALHSVVERQGADLLVVGSAHRGPVGRVMLGDDARGALDGARCAVAVAPHGLAIPRALQAIAVGDDGSPESALALGAARALAGHSGARIRVCAVVGPGSLSYRELTRMDPSEALARRVDSEEARLSAYEGVEVDVLEGEPGEALAGIGREVDLLVIGSRAQGLWGRLSTGSTAAYLVRHAGCPVLILPRTIASAEPPAPVAPAPGPRQIAATG